MDSWRAAELFVAADLDGRWQGLQALAEGDAVFSPLALYLLAARLDESDVGLRREIIAALARCFLENGARGAAQRPAREFLAGLLARFGRAQVERLLEAAAPVEPGRFFLDQRPVAVLLERIPRLAELLTRIAADRSQPLAVRLTAIAGLGDLGVIEALPALEGLQARVAGQTAGQLAMAFAPAPERDFGLLLSTVNAAIQMLRENE